jgi:hypothetical protein
MTGKGDMGKLRLTLEAHKSILDIALDIALDMAALYATNSFLLLLSTS